MRAALVAVAAGLLWVGASLAEAGQFEGAWFAVSVPEGFAVEEVRPSGSADGAEAVLLHAPDGRAAIFLHVPQWAAPAPEVAAAPGEVMVAEWSRRAGHLTTTWRTFEDPATGWRRTLRIVEDTLGPTLIVTGIAHADAAALARWHAAYAAAVASLEPLAD